jgi:cyclopropane fatty-acyl-phospholipid synthase-like methyltransferase
MLVSVIVILILLAAIYLLARPVIRGAIFFPTSRRNVEVMLDMASLREGARIADLGSGDGRILIACARRGMRAEGYEINPILVFRSRWAIRKAGFQDLAVVHWKSFWRADLAPFDAIFVYGIPYIMGGLRNKLERELRPGVKVVSHVFSFPEWTPAMKHEHEKVYLYEIGKKRP